MGNKRGRVWTTVLLCIVYLLLYCIDASRIERNFAITCFVLYLEQNFLKNSVKYATHSPTGMSMMEITTQSGKRIYLIFQHELCDPVNVGDYVRVYCHLHGSDHQRSLSINKATGWGHCFNATCDATVLVAEWNQPVARRLMSRSFRRDTSQSYVVTSPPKRIPDVTQPTLLLPAKAPPLWQQEERLALLSLDEQMRLALQQFPRARAYLRERGIPLRIAVDAGVGYLPPELLRTQGKEKRELLPRWGERLLFPLDSLDGKGYIGRSLWHWVPGMDENRHKALLDGPGTPRRWIKTNPAGWFGYDPDTLSRHVILVEGAFDRLALLAAGIRPTEVMALAGTALRTYWFPWHVRTVLLALDGDDGGRQASEKLVEQLERAGIQTGICSPPCDQWGKDWSERWRTGGRGSLSRLFEARFLLLPQRMQA